MYINLFVVVICIWWKVFQYAILLMLKFDNILVKQALFSRICSHYLLSYNGIHALVLLQFTYESRCEETIS